MDYKMPEALAGLFTPTVGGVFRNDRGDYLIEPVGGSIDGELILVRADGSTATLRGEWESGFDA